jgi:peptidoglycan/xylan/chitin deacetylase (PgdA/CDA1 family)
MLGFIKPAISQDEKEFYNVAFLKKLNKDKTYTDLKKKIISEFKNTSPGHWGEFVKGVDEDIITKQKIIAFTFDACGGKNGDGYDIELINYLREQKIPATLFISGKWIDSHFSDFLVLSKDKNFEIENHGLKHQPSSVNGASVYGIHGTSDIEDAYDEIEANALKIKAITNHYPQFYRSATAYIDEASAAMAIKLGITTISYDVLSGDAVPFTDEKIIENNVLKKIRPGAIVIMHFNHPEWNTFEAMEKIVPILRERGYSFVCLKNYKLTSSDNNSKINTIHPELNKTK